MKESQKFKEHLHTLLKYQNNQVASSPYKEK